MAYAVLSALRSLAVGPITALLVGYWFTGSEQGFYYTFKSLIAVAIVVELGMPLVIVPFVSHEWVRVRWDGQELSGPPEALDRLRGLCRAALCWYLATVLLLLGGTLLLGSTLVGPQEAAAPGVSSAWFLPWLWLCVWSAGDYLVRPLLSLLEGCQQVEPVFRVRLWQGLCMALATWVAIVAGGGLWCLPAGAGASTLFGLGALTGYRRLLRAVLARPERPQVSWRAEIWPMAWRIALTSIGGVVWTSVTIPIVFRLRGPELAGQLGMTLALTQGLSTIMTTWSQVRAPRVAELVARRDTAELHALLRRLALLTLGTGLLGAVCIELLVLGLDLAGHRLYSRMLPELPTALFLAGSLLSTATLPLATYLRAHKQEPFLLPTVAGAACLVLSLLALTPRYGGLGAALAYLGTVVLLTPLTLGIWNSRRKAWYPPGSE